MHWSDEYMMLKISNLTIKYGVIKALDNVTLEVMPGEILSVIGANGAGKTTLLKAIAGLLKPQGGNIKFEDREISGLKPEKIVKSGITMVPEGRRVFPDLSVKENLELGGYSLEDRHLKKELYGLILTTFPRLDDRLKQNAGTLSGGEQQMLAMGRALMANPKLLLLDEPSMGLSPIITKEIFALIQLINKEKHISMILVEQNAHLAMEHSQRTYVLENGSIVMEGESSVLKNDARITEAYLGV
jgi:branched-chain amino acid transport system ATP-binding protein